MLSKVLSKAWLILFLVISAITPNLVRAQTAPSSTNVSPDRGLRVLRVLGVRGEVVFEQEFQSSNGTLGQLTDAILQEAVLRQKLRAYVGSERGVSSINELGSALEVLSDREMNAYGWCYQVDGRSSNLMADEYALDGQEQLIEWYYAYAKYDRTEWTAMCVPADHLPTKD